MNTATVTIASANTGSGRRAMGDAKDTRNDQESTAEDKSHSQMLGKFEYGGGPIFKVVLES